MKSRAMQKSSDFDLRACIVRHLLASGTLRSNIRHEITLDTSSSGGRADMVVLADDCIHGIEIKSGKDVLERLRKQIESYRQCFDAVHVVVDKIHGEPAFDIFHEAAQYCHEEKVIIGRRGYLYNLKLMPSYAYSQETSPVAMARLLWRAEVQKITRDMGYYRENRYSGINAIRENACLKDLRPRVIAALRGRIESLWEKSFWEKFDAIKMAGV